MNLIGGALCLDFTNTVGWRGGPDSDEKLYDYEDLIVWGRHAGALSERHGKELLKRAASEPARAVAVCEQAILLREALYRMFSSVAAGRAAGPTDLATINAAVADAYQHLRLAPRPSSGLAPRPPSELAPRPPSELAPRPPSELAPRPPSELAPLGDSFAWEWHEADGSLELPVWMIARSAAELLTSDSLGRVRECAGERCDWLFLDASRNRSRRWCDMAECGNRAKAQRSYARRRGSTDAERASKGRKT
jgi:predicted RNA-binding Zn ribbon-like protein